MRKPDMRTLSTPFPGAGFFKTLIFRQLYICIKYLLVRTYVPPPPRMLSGNFNFPKGLSYIFVQFHLFIPRIKH